MFEQLLIVGTTKRGDRFARVLSVLAESRLQDNWQYLCNLPGCVSLAPWRMARSAAEDEVEE